MSPYFGIRLFGGKSGAPARGISVETDSDLEEMLEAAGAKPARGETGADDAAGQESEPLSEIEEMLK